MSDNNFHTRAGEGITTALQIIFAIIAIIILFTTMDTSINGIWDLIGLVFMIFLGAFIGGLAGMLAGMFIDLILSLFTD